MGARQLVVLFAVFALAFIAIEFVLNRGADGALLLTLTYFTMIVQGCVALAAVAEVAKGVWLTPIKRELLSVYPILPLIAVLFFVMGFKMDIYPWHHDSPNLWLSRNFFIGRNIVLLLLTFWAAHLLARAAMKGDPRRVRYGVIYIMLYVTSISLVAFDWIMSLEYPWISTLLGGYFFIQAFLMGLTVSVFIIFFRMRRGDEGVTETLRDAAKMILAFCFMWAGFMFAQYLVIWYGNIPEEVAYLHKRVVPAPYKMLSTIVLAAVFVIPFVTLLSRLIKTMPGPMSLVALLVMSGLLLEKIILVAPVVPINPVAAAVELALMIVLLVLVIRGRDSFLPQRVTAESGARG